MSSVCFRPLERQCLLAVVSCATSRDSGTILPLRCTTTYRRGRRGRSVSMGTRAQSSNDCRHRGRRSPPPEPRGRDDADRDAGLARRWPRP